jgi:hypothetical protein
VQSLPPANRAHDFSLPLSLETLLYIIKIK